MIFIENTNAMDELSTRINQDIKFIDINTLKVFEQYSINGEYKTNQLGFFNSNYQYQQVIDTQFLERRSNFHGYHMKAIADEVGPFVYFNLSTATLDETTQMYDVTHSTKGMYYDLFLALQEKLNFTAKLYKRKDSKWGMVNLLSNGSVIASGMHADLAEGDAEIVLQ